MKAFVICLAAALAVCCISYAAASPRGTQLPPACIKPLPNRGAINRPHSGQHRGFASDDLTSTVFDRPTPLDIMDIGVR